MTLSARLYLSVVAIYCFALAFVCLVVPERLNSVSFQAVRDNMPGGFTGWVVVHSALALLAGWAALSGREKPALITLVVAAAVVGAWAWGFWRAEFLLDIPEDKRGAPTGFIAYSTLTAIHLIMARQPLRSPFETLERVLSRDA